MKALCLFGMLPPDRYNQHLGGKKDFNIFCQIFSQLEEHEKRVWSVDFSKCDPTQLASGSDDTKGTHINET